MNWISVKDRLPENRVPVVLLIVGFGKILFDVGYYSVSDKFFVKYKGGPVTHWCEITNIPDIDVTQY